MTLFILRDPTLGDPTCFLSNFLASCFGVEIFCDGINQRFRYPIMLQHSEHDLSVDGVKGLLKLILYTM